MQNEHISNENENQVAREARAQEARAQEARAQEARAQEARAKEAHAQEARAQEARAQEARAQEARAQEVRAQEARAQKARAQEARAQDARAQEVSAQEVRAREDRAQEAKAQGARAQEVRSQETRAQEARAQDAKAQEIRAQEARAPKTLIMRDYPRGIFFYPLAIFSIIAALIEHIGESNEPSEPWLFANTLSMIWLVLFFVSTFIVCFDLSAGKFIAVVFLLVVVGLLITFVSLNNTPSIGGEFVFNIQLRTQFYWMTSAILGIIVLFSFVVAQFRYVKMERNEVLVKGILGDVLRFPTGSLNYEKRIPDVLKFILLGSGTVILHIPGVTLPVELKTVILVNRKARQMDAILSTIKTTR